MMKAVSFMYVRPPGYNPESAKAAEIADEQKRLGQTSTEQNPTEGTSSIKYLFHFLQFCKSFMFFYLFFKQKLINLFEHLYH